MRRLSDRPAFGHRIRMRGLIASTLFLAACATPDGRVTDYDQFPLNQGQGRHGEALIKVIALIPGGGVLADAVGSELAKRGFVIIPAASTVGMAGEIDFEIIRDARIPARVNLEELNRLRVRLRAQGVDAFLTVTAEQFAPRPWQQHRYWQQAGFSIQLTRGASVLFNGEVSFGSWANIDDRPKSAAEAAAEIVTSMATRTAL